MKSLFHCFYVSLRVSWEFEASSTKSQNVLESMFSDKQSETMLICDVHIGWRSKQPNYASIDQVCDVHIGDEGVGNYASIDQVYIHMFT